MVDFSDLFEPIHRRHRKRERIVQLIFFGAYIANTLFDLITFLIFPKWHIFETNPIIRLVPFGIYIGIGLKLLLIPIVIIYVTKTRGEIIKYAVLLGILYVTFLQILGGLSNLQVHHDVPNPTANMTLPTSQAVQAYKTTAIYYYLIPIFFAVVGYAIMKYGGFRK